LVSALVVGFLVYLSRRSGTRDSVQIQHQADPSLQPGHLELDQIAELIPESKFIDIDGHRLHYVQSGQGPDVVLIHGIGASVFIWRFLFPLLQKHYRLTAFDLTGFGKSSKDRRFDYGLDSQAAMIIKALSAIGIERAHLVGSSMGGAVALWMARESFARFPKVAVLGPAADSALVSSKVKHLAATAPFLRHSLNRQTMRMFLRRVVVNKGLVTDDVVEKYLEPFLDNGDTLHAFIASTSLLSDSRLPSGLSDIKSEVLIVWGEHDLQVPRRSLDRVIKAIKHSHLAVHRNAGHHIMEDDPTWTANELEGFFNHNQRPSPNAPKPVL
jgi:pimeloyl-ACP methyl ester carboxylesterase